MEHEDGSIILLREHSKAPSRINVFVRTQKFDEKIALHRFAMLGAPSVKKRYERK